MSITTTPNKDHTVHLHEMVELNGRTKASIEQAAEHKKQRRKEARKK